MQDVDYQVDKHILEEAIRCNPASLLDFVDCDHNSDNNGLETVWHSLVEGLMLESPDELESLEMIEANKMNRLLKQQRLNHIDRMRYVEGNSIAKSSGAYQSAMDSQGDNATVSLLPSEPLHIHHVIQQPAAKAFLRRVSVAAILHNRKNLSSSNVEAMVGGAESLKTGYNRNNLMSDFEEESTSCVDMKQQATSQSVFSGAYIIFTVLILLLLILLFILLLLFSLLLLILTYFSYLNLYSQGLQLCSQIFTLMVSKTCPYRSTSTYNQ